MNISSNYVLIMASGGIDSTACIHFYKQLEFEVNLIFFDYGQPSRKKEYSAISSISKFYSIPLKKIVIKNFKTIKDGFVQGRNALFYFLALSNFEKDNGIIASGIHYGTNYYDCSEAFLIQIQEIFVKYSDSTIKAAAPFLSFSKVDIQNYCKKENVPLYLTYSCELGKRQPCGICKTCQDLLIINKNKCE